MGELERLRNDADIELKETGRWATTFTQIQCWGMRIGPVDIDVPPRCEPPGKCGNLMPATMITGYARRRVVLRTHRMSGNQLLSNRRRPGI